MFSISGRRWNGETECWRDQGKKCCRATDSGTNLDATVSARGFGGIFREMCQASQAGSLARMLVHQALGQ